MCIPASATPSSPQPPNPASSPPQILQHLPGVEGPRALCRLYSWCADPLPDRLYPTEHSRAGWKDKSLLCLWYQEQCRKDTQHQCAG